jgi:predicted NUDIX family NTP pyrophosphohydrolase
MARQSAGLLVFRRTNKILEVLLVHPGGPFFKKKDDGAWSIPKGEYEEGEDGLTAATREFEEELGAHVDGMFIPLITIKQKGGKLVHAWAVEASPDITGFRSNTFTMEWPPRSGKKQEFPEVDKAEWFTPEEAKRKINTAQIPLIDELQYILENRETN